MVTSSRASGLLAGEQNVRARRGRSRRFPVLISAQSRNVIIPAIPQRV